MYYVLCADIEAGTPLIMLEPACAAVFRVVDGFSCREQIAQATGRHALHFAEVVTQGLDWQAPLYMSAIGKRRWAIAEGYIPHPGEEQSHELVSHEAICILNSGDGDAHVKIQAYFADRVRRGRIVSSCRRDALCICA